jgi:hypothetical protein
MTEAPKKKLKSLADQKFSNCPTWFKNWRIQYETATEAVDVPARDEVYSDDWPKANETKEAWQQRMADEGKYGSVITGGRRATPSRWEDNDDLMGIGNQEQAFEEEKKRVRGKCSQSLKRLHRAPTSRQLTPRSQLLASRFRPAQAAQPAAPPAAALLFQSSNGATLSPPTTAVTRTRGLV